MNKFVDNRVGSSREEEEERIFYLSIRYPDQYREIYDSLTSNLLDFDLYFKRNQPHLGVDFLFFDSIEKCVLTWTNSKSHDMVKVLALYHMVDLTNSNEDVEQIKLLLKSNHVDSSSIHLINYITSKKLDELKIQQKLQNIR